MCNLLQHLSFPHEVHNVARCVFHCSPAGSSTRTVAAHADDLRPQRDQRMETLLGVQRHLRAGEQHGACIGNGRDLWLCAVRGVFSMVQDVLATP